MNDGSSCDVCKSGSITWVAAMPGVPMSFGYCQPCLRADAHPLWAIHSLIDACNGPENIAEWVKTMGSFSNGKYIRWEDIVKCYTPDRSTN